MENPPLWVWAIIIGAIIASKFIYRWQATKQFAKEDQERRIRETSTPTKEQKILIIIICMAILTEDIAQI